MDSSIVISVDKVQKSYRIYHNPVYRIIETFYPGEKCFHRPFLALDNVSFTVRKGDFLGIIGKNGSGKSTLLQLICGIILPSKGTITVNGKISALLELGAGFNPDFTGRQNIYMNATILGLKKEEIDAKYDSIVTFADIGDFIDLPIKTYSSGMVVRLAFAVQANVEPDILIVDEALSVGDSYFQAKCTKLMSTLIDKGVTILYVTHDITSVPLLCDRAIYLENGNIKTIGPAIDVVDRYLRDVRREQYQAEPEKTEQIDSSRVDKSISEVPANMEKMEYVPQARPVASIPRNPARENEFYKKVQAYRYGTGGAQILFIEMLDEDNQAADTFGFREKVTVRALIEIKKELDALNCCLIIRNKQGVEIMHCTTREYGYVFGTVRQNTIVEVDISFENILKPGNAYTVHYTVNNTYSLQDQEILDLIELGVVFNVKPDPDHPIYYLIWHPFTFGHRSV